MNKKLYAQEAIKYGLKTAVKFYPFTLLLTLMALLVGFLGVLAMIAINSPFLIVMYKNIEKLMSFSGIMKLETLFSMITNLSNYWPLYLALFIVSFFVMLFFVTLINAGFANALLHIHDTQSSSLQAFFVPVYLVGRLFTATLLFMLLLVALSLLFIPGVWVIFYYPDMDIILKAVLGTALISIPTVILFIVFWKYIFYFYVLLDTKCGVIESFGKSARIMYGAQLKLVGFIFLFSLAAGLLNTLSNFILSMILLRQILHIVSFFVQLLFNFVMLFGMVFIYRQLKAQTDEMVVPVKE